MKKLIFTLSCVLLLASCAGEAPIGKSIGRSNDLTVESLQQDLADGLEYLEVTMNNVIGKDTAGVKDRAAALKAKMEDIMRPARAKSASRLSSSSSL